MIMNNPQAVTKNDAFGTLKAFLARPDTQQAIQKAAPKHLSPDRQLRVCLTAALGQPKIAEACLHPSGRASLIKALLTATQRGLEVDGRQGHLVPFNDKRLGMLIQFIPGYQGLVDLAYNHPKVKSIWWNVVLERDEFVWRDGLDRRLVHVKYDGEDDPGKLRYAYAVCELDGGAKSFVCLNRREVMHAKASSRGAESNYSPWTTHEAAMWAKTAVRALCKQIPQSAELRDALSIDDRANDTKVDASVFVMPQASTESIAEITAADPMPEDATPPQEARPSPEPATLGPSIKEQLATIVTDAGHTFDDFIKWGTESGTINRPEADAMGSFDEVPQAMASRFVKAKAGMLKGIEMTKGIAV